MLRGNPHPSQMTSSAAIAWERVQDQGLRHLRKENEQPHQLSHKAIGAQQLQTEEPVKILHFLLSCYLRIEEHLHVPNASVQKAKS